MKNTKNLRKILFLAILILSIGNLSYSYEDYYNKVYIVKISKKDIFKAVNANQKQQKKLSEIFDNYQRKAEKIEKQLKSFEGKKEQIGKIEKERYMKVAEVLSFEQLTAFNKYINGKKLEFEEKNDKIKNLLDNLNLTNEQKSEILKQDRDFKREVNKLKDERLSESDFVSRYDSLKNVRNEKIREVLNEEQRKIVDSY
jgi:viral A-type inclusion protein